MGDAHLEGMVARINAVPIERSGMFAFVESLGALGPEDRDMEGHMMRAIAFFAARRPYRSTSD